MRRTSYAIHNLIMIALTVVCIPCIDYYENAYLLTVVCYYDAIPGSSNVLLTSNIPTTSHTHFVQVTTSTQV